MGERDALTRLTEEHCPFVVEVYATFHTDTDVVFVTEYIPGGELYMYMGDRMKESVAKFYVAQLAIALDFMHKYVVVLNMLPWVPP